MNPRATFDYRDDEISDRYCMETIRKAMVMLEPMQTRIRKKGVDSHINNALNELQLAMAAYEYPDRRR